MYKTILYITTCILPVRRFKYVMYADNNTIYSNLYPFNSIIKICLRCIYIIIYSTYIIITTSRPLIMISLLNILKTIPYILKLPIEIVRMIRNCVYLEFSEPLNYNINLHYIVCLNLFEIFHQSNLLFKFCSTFAHSV